MVEKPFFSIVIPTKNRPELLRDAIQSVLLQSFTEFELIVSDNHNDAATKEVIDSFPEDGRLRYVRPTDELNMLDHWEFATCQAIGRYVVLLTDRNVLCQHSLKKIKRVIDTHKDINFISFGTKAFLEHQNKFGTRSTTGKSRMYNSKELVDNFKGAIYYSSGSLDFFAPKTINSCYKNEIAQKIRREKGSYFNLRGVSTPDYASFFVNTLMDQQCYFLGDTIMLGQGASVSNGSNFAKGDTSYFKTLGANYELHASLADVPFIYNCIYNDFIVIYSYWGKQDFPLTFNYDIYFANLLLELMIKREAGASEEICLSFEKSVQQAMIEHGFSEKKIHEITELANGCFMKDRSKTNMFLKNWKIHFKDFLFHRFNDNKLLNRIFKYKYDSILTAAGFDYYKALR
ncbi:glycosyltransferase family 2 protein [Crocinitomicaceae bacterium CZZ-1]|uniref:Glycosyltransferase family 2 protein n=1 Tax=Taishania pollutisoli TaxID=2766479 RepID=A0A8J6TX11_9FLAO|nr:glycosyltransferase family A protein [Taishania pollutisoli]MBC9811801.1 glycosyltransferase family 2 protein [Taishania pollutisoli]MBX2948264.1 glycosyltransferase family 2 protein [Crocinitomicaceae bacterium]NGF75362.1 glycosyltransferase family 2 protein [Fluviicola sp. SGL-29]